MTILGTTEGRRLLAAARGEGWRRWGPYLSERQWGTVREDYSPGGTAWDSVPHDHARSRAYRWDEDGIAGFSDDRQHWCLSLALWNGRDPVLKERLFGLTNSECTRPALRGGGPPACGLGGEPALLFHEFFHGETGQGLGASHQTGWTSLVALPIQDRRRAA